MATIITVPIVPSNVTVYAPPGVPLIVAGPLTINNTTGKPLVEVGAVTVNGWVLGVLLVMVENAEIVCDKYATPKRAVTSVAAL